MASMWTPIIGIVLLLSLLVPPSTASSPMVFEIKGDVYPTGHFYITMYIGYPPKPYYLDVDTGSTLTWLQCDIPCRSCNKVPHLYDPRKSKTTMVQCADRRCNALHRDMGAGKLPCLKPTQCDYKVQYAGGSSKGMLIEESFYLQRNARRLAFGCGYDQNVGANFKRSSPVDGLLGLGRGSVDLVSQLKGLQIVAKHVVGHCLGSGGRGFLFFGDDGEALLPPSGITWVPMAKSGIYYSPAGSATLCFNGQPLGGVKPMNLIFDSGTTYTYFPAQPYRATVTVVKSSVSRSLTEVKDHALPLCWKGRQTFRSVHDVEQEFKPLSFRFANGNATATMEIPPARYLIVTKDGNVCLGILDGSEVNLGQSSLIGDITLQNQIVVYDNERTRLGWVDAACDRMASSESAITSRL